MTRPDERRFGGADPATVRAAGVVLWRRSPYGGGVEIALIHRPRYDDWSLPKGKLKRGEETAAAALRETREETGMECVLGAPLPTTRYVVEGRPKEVRYWAAEATGGAFAVSREVDRMVWLPAAAARHRLTHDRDRPLVDALLRTLAG
ncbi:NUDIX hydrolase [Actinacidiphila sp. ITFR-21]|uniref:NUDIX hydrolase n=1 Tax=Actinacidiphila sp. ITFR-21 TaxID=3075199 RepID=UPI00288B57BD|nr:NUDIX hydrolase [Streptomyces sp. ITFR-21]WNI16996.1 NUDIX hydrolase [Streptomyces sp. ITFR-21]